MPPASAWLLDFGNSRLKVLHSDDEAPARPAAVSREAIERGDELHLSQFLSALAPRPPASLVIAALGRTGDGELLGPLLNRFAPGARLVVIGPEHLSPAKVLYTSGQPGGDRIANALAVRRAAPGQWAAAIDFGTATHITVVDPEGNLVGGSILPGLRMLSRALARETGGRLPEIEPFKAPEKVPGLGNSTQGALQSGVIIGHVGSIEGILEAIESECAAPFGCIFATGGGAFKLLPYLHKWPIGHNPTLTLEGLGCLLERLA